MFSDVPYSGEKLQYNKDFSGNKFPYYVGKEALSMHRSFFSAFSRLCCIHTSKVDCATLGRPVFRFFFLPFAGGTRKLHSCFGRASPHHHDGDTRREEEQSLFPLSHSTEDDYGDFFKVCGTARRRRRREKRRKSSIWPQNSRFHPRIVFPAMLGRERVSEREREEESDDKKNSFSFFLPDPK